MYLLKYLGAICLHYIWYVRIEYIGCLKWRLKVNFQKRTSINIFFWGNRITRRCNLMFSFWKFTFNLHFKDHMHSIPMYFNANKHGLISILFGAIHIIKLVGIVRLVFLKATKIEEAKVRQSNNLLFNEKWLKERQEMNAHQSPL